MSGLLHRRVATGADLDRVLAEGRAVGRFDESEIKAVFGASAERWTGEIAGEFAGCWGVLAPSVMHPGQLWMVGTPVVEKHKLVFFRHARAWVSEALGRYGALGGFVEAGCPQRWLELMGFRLSPEEDGVRRFEAWL